MYRITICHLYPELLNLYGDTGNITALIKRCQWRHIDVRLIKYNIGDRINYDDIDVFFMGGGADSEQVIASSDMMKIKSYLQQAVEEGKVMLAICGGYQLLGNYYQTKQGPIEGLGILDLHTESGDKRLVGNMIVKMATEKPYFLLGFENHTGRTFLHGLKPLGYVVSGHGNNDVDRTEGVRYKNVFGTYLHGPLLPKNPLLCDEIILTALKNRYGVETLEKLDDSLEEKARSYIMKALHRGRLKI